MMRGGSWATKVTHSRRAPSFGTDCHPYARWHLIGQIVKGKRGNETDHSVRNALIRFGEGVMDIDRRVWKLIKPTAPPHKGPGAFET